MGLFSKVVILKIVLLGFCSANIRSNTCKNRDTACVIESFGYSASCVISSLSSCENSPLQYSIQKDIKDLTISLNKFSKGKSPGGQSSSRPRNCADLLNQPRNSGKQTIYPYDSFPNKPVIVFCEQNVERGGWTVIQRRDDVLIRENFTRTWQEYKLGFGDVDSEFWLGLDTIHALTAGQLMELRVDMEDWDNEKRFAKYGFFYVADESDKYRLRVYRYSGDAGDSLNSEFDGYKHNGRMFSTFDNDNDNKKSNESSCAEKHKGAWWYDRCHTANLNALPLIGKSASQGEGISWHTFRGTFYSLKKVTMMIRPAFNLF